MKTIVDLYTLRARLKPALFVALPFTLSILAWFPAGIIGWGTLWGLLVWCGVTFFLSQIGRDFGKQKETDLFRRWGGKPTTKMIRHRDAANKTLVDRYHNKLQSLLKDIKIPSVDDEKSDPSAADEIYDGCVSYLREKTRNKKKFPLVFEENCNYGFRRNLWGMKSFGITISIISICVIFFLVLTNYIFKDISIPPIVFIYLLIDCLILFIWIFLINTDWVKIAADAYAERLLSSSENL